MIPKIIEILRKTGSSTNDLIHNQQLIKNLIDYLDTNLIFLKANLVGENFERVLSVVWSATSSAISDIIAEGINNKMSAPYFTNLTQTFRILLNFFFGENIPQNDLVIDGISHTLKLYSYNIGDLILTYYDRRYLDQRLLSAFCCVLKNDNSSPFLKIRIQFVGSILPLKQTNDCLNV